MMTRKLPSTIFNVSVPDKVLAKVQADTRTITAAQLRTAWSVSPLAQLRCITLADKFFVTSEDAWKLALPYVGTRKLEYQTDYWVCREFSRLFSVVAAGCLKLDGTAVVLDFGGHHAYNAVAAFDTETALKVLMLEPQTDRLVPKLDPAKHYVGKQGMALWG